MAELTQADRYLLEQIRRGDGDGWASLVSRYQGRLLAFARARLKQSADAEDIVQDTFFHFLKGLPNFREDASVETYLFTILRRRKQVVEFVRYPREGHELTRSGEPRHRADHMERMLEWFDRYCMPKNRDA